MSAGMAGVIAAHVLWMSGETETVWQPAEESAQCSCGHDYDSWVHTAGGDESPDWDKEHAAHVAEELAKAGYGDVPAALLAAADEMPIETLAGADKASVWLRHRAHSQDPEGHALVKAIHDRKGATAQDLLGIAPDWTDGKSTDEYMDEQRNR
jgi:hypothetical protein